MSAMKNTIAQIFFASLLLRNALSFVPSLSHVSRVVAPSPSLTSPSSTSPSLTSPSLTSPSPLSSPCLLNLFRKESETDESASSQDDNKPQNNKKQILFSKQMRRSFLVSSSLAILTNIGLAVAAPPGFKRIPTQFIAAIADPQSSSGDTAREWGLWTVDPGPRGVYLKDYKKDLQSKGNRAPAGWTFDEKDWWVEEHGLIMEAPAFPLEAGRYIVTGGRLVTTILDVRDDGRWSLDKGVLYDVTHLPCRSARYTPKGGVGSATGSPLTARQSDFPVKPGAEMPPVEGCDKVDYAVLFVIGKEVV